MSNNDRQFETYSEIIKITAKLIESLLCDVRQHIGWLFNITESIAFLDMILSFANIVSLKDNYGMKKLLLK